MGMSKRIFIGIPASEEIKKLAGEWGLTSLNPSFERREIKSTPLLAKERQGEVNIRWVAPRNLHITLVPPWQAEEAEMPDIINRLKNVCHFDPERAERVEGDKSLNDRNLRDPSTRPDKLGLGLDDKHLKPFTISFSKIEFGPNAREPRMIWATGKAEKTINDLRLTIYRSLGFEIDERPFRLHITLARIKASNLSRPFGSPSPSFGEGKNEWAIVWQMKVDRFVLYESRLLPEGAEYKVIEEIRFKM